MDKLNLKTYYNQKAKKNDEIRITYESKNYYKKFFYLTRFNKVIKLLNPVTGDKILDVGCGSGFYVRYLLKKKVQVTAVDISDEYIKQAKKYAGSKAKYVVTDARKLPFKNQSFDKVLITEVIEHVSDYQKIIEEGFRVLITGGKIVITTPNKYSHMNYAYRLKRKIRRYTFNEHMAELSYKNLFYEVSKYASVESICFSNYLIPYPLDTIAEKFNSKLLIRLLTRIENLFSALPLLKYLGWTAIISGTKNE